MKPYYSAFIAGLSSALLFVSMAGGVSAWPIDQRATPYSNPTAQASPTQKSPSALHLQKKCPPSRHSALHFPWWSS